MPGFISTRCGIDEILIADWSGSLLGAIFESQLACDVVHIAMSVWVRLVLKEWMTDCHLHKITEYVFVAECCKTIHIIENQGVLISL